jgi:hypothetical protein
MLQWLQASALFEPYPYTRKKKNKPKVHVHMFDSELKPDYDEKQAFTILYVSIGNTINTWGSLHEMFLEL